jgi:hypothetical protein
MVFMHAHPICKVGEYTWNTLTIFHNYFKIQSQFNKIFSLGTCPPGWVGLMAKPV